MELMQLMQDSLPLSRRNDEGFTLQDKTILDSEGFSVLPVWMEGTRDLLDGLGPASDDEVGKSSDFWIIDEGLLKGFFVVWHYADMVDGNIQWKVWAWPGAESREGVWYDHFLAWAVMDCEVISLQV